MCRKIQRRKEEMECRSNNSGKKQKRTDLAASNITKYEGKDINTEKQFLGEVPGVEVGDIFRYRAELAVVGMHRPYRAGINSMEHEGVLVANSIVASGSYNDDTTHDDVLIYSGHGGNFEENNETNKNHEDQKLEKGNLSLSNSIGKGTPVRVMETHLSDSKSKPVFDYYYDGLYTVEKCWTKKCSHGKLKYMFKLTRNPRQNELPWKELRKACNSKIREGVCIRDISRGIERSRVCAVNVLDDEKPPEFTYISKMMYPYWYRPSPPTDCACVRGCKDFRNCGCARRNGGKMPYTRDGVIVETKPIVYECGPRCQCPPTCYNRVTQRGIKVQLEIFKTNRNGWGLRALTSIPYGTFICEYVGEHIKHKETQRRIRQDEYFFYVGKNGDAEKEGYIIDARRSGNVGQFINQSCSPNLYAQYVMYDDNMPHVMFFARENIAPFKELTLDYNKEVNQIQDSNGSFESKKCLCGSADCRGRLY